MPSHSYAITVNNSDQAYLGKARGGADNTQTWFALSALSPVLLRKTYRLDAVFGTTACIFALLQQEGPYPPFKRGT